jgi:DNA anti-recombination protein RmuC
LGLVAFRFFVPQNLDLKKVEETIGKKQNENLFQTLSEIGKIQTQIQLHIQAQETEFVKLKAQNAEAINIFATDFRKELSQTSNSLIIANNSQIVKLQESNQRSFEQLSSQNQIQLGEINNQVQARLDQNFAQHLKSFEAVSQSVGKVQALAQNMIDSTSSIEKLNQIFAKTASKSYGNFGEEYLENILQEHLPKSLWNKQVLVVGGKEKIDFTIKMDDKTIGIDSKFPVGAYEQYIETGDAKQFYNSVQKMATEIAQKYHTISDQLLMFFPSDSMYVLVTQNLDLMTKLQKMCISPVSPATFFPFIMTMKGKC